MYFVSGAVPQILTGAQSLTLHPAGDFCPPDLLKSGPPATKTSYAPDHGEANNDQPCPHNTSACTQWRSHRARERRTKNGRSRPTLKKTHRYSEQVTWAYHVTRWKSPNSSLLCQPESTFDCLKQIHQSRPFVHYHSRTFSYLGRQSSLIKVKR